MAGLACAAALSLLACGDIEIDLSENDDARTISSSGNTFTEEYAFEDFDRIDVSHSFDVIVTRADAFSVSITLDDNLRDRLVVETTGDRLRMGLQNNTSTRGNPEMRAEVAMPAIRAAHLSGAAAVALRGFDAADRVELHLSGASRVTGDLTADVVDVDVSGASVVDLTGAARVADVGASGASSVRLGDYALDTASVNLSGASNCEMNVERELTSVRLSGASRLVYHGDPTFGEIVTSGDSSIDEW